MTLEVMIPLVIIRKGYVKKNKNTYLKIDVYNTQEVGHFKKNTQRKYNERQKRDKVPKGL